MDWLTKIPGVGPLVVRLMATHAWRSYERLDRVKWTRLAAAMTFISFVALFPLLTVAAAIGAATLSDQQQNRWIYGVAYWFPHQGAVTTAIMLDYDGQQFNNIITAPVHAVTLHGLINF